MFCPVNKYYAHLIWQMNEYFKKKTNDKVKMGTLAAHGDEMT